MFHDRLPALPRLGIGLSTEYGAIASPGALDPMALRAHAPQYASFLELGVELSKGLDSAAEAWAANHPVTWHFLDINLDDPEDFDPEWIAGSRALIDRVRPAWACGDAGLWHFGRRDRGQMLLLPPILTAGSADRLAEGVARLREAWGLEVLPENPPGVAFVGDMHLLDFFGRVAERADTGLLLDCAHLAIYQQLQGNAPLDGLDGFPLDRVVEIHIAGGVRRQHRGFSYIEDSHTTDVLPETWEIVGRVLAGARNLRAVVFECERNGLEATLPGFARIAEMVERYLPGFSQERKVEEPANIQHDVKIRHDVRTDRQEVDAARLQQAAVRLMHDPAMVARLYGGSRPEPLREAEAAMLRRVDARAWGVDGWRRAGLITALLEEFPVSAACLGIGALEAFLSGPGFAEVVAARGSMAEAAAAALAAHRPILWLARIEGMVARCRRARSVGGPGWRLAPGVEAQELPEGTLAAWQELRAQMGADPAAWAVAGGRLRAPAAGRAREWLVVQPGPQGPQLSIQPEPVARLLEKVRGGRGDGEVRRWLGRQGVAAGEVDELLAGFVEDGLLVYNGA